MPTHDRTIRPAASGDIAALSALHSATFPHPWPHPWSKAFWTAELQNPLSTTLVVVDPEGALEGFILARRTADEAEMLSIAVDPANRRQGIAGALLDQLAAALRSDLPCRLFLEVSIENPAALAFYRRRGFIEVGYRKGYYDAPGRAPIDARILALDLAP